MRTKEVKINLRAVKKIPSVQFGNFDIECTMEKILLSDNEDLETEKSVVLEQQKLLMKQVIKGLEMLKTDFDKMGENDFVLPRL